MIMFNRRVLVVNLKPRSNLIRISSVMTADKREDPETYYICVTYSPSRGLSLSPLSKQSSTDRIVQAFIFIFNLPRGSETANWRRGT
jgi:hypothetical protein